MAIDEKKLERVLKKISAGSIKTSEAADYLGCTVRHLNRKMLQAGVERPTGARTLLDKEAAERKEAKELAAKAVISGIFSMEQAAKLSETSKRTMTRWVKKLKDE